MEVKPIDIIGYTSTDLLERAATNKGFNFIVHKECIPLDVNNLELGRFISTKGYLITLTEKDKQTIVNKNSMYLTGEAGIYNIYDVLRAIFDAKAISELGFFKGERITVFDKNKEGFYPAEHGLINTPEYNLVVFKKEDFKEVKLTKEEKEILEQHDKKTVDVKFKKLVAKDLILELLKKYQIDYINNGDYFTFSNIKSYNQLMYDALNHYINEELLKETGIKMNIGKAQPDNSIFSANSILCRTEDLDLNLPK